MTGSSTNSVQALMLPASVASVLHLVWPLHQSLSSMVKPTRSKTPAGRASGVFEAHKPPNCGKVTTLWGVSIDECDECTFPDVLKYADIAALFKKLDRLCKENYRPVSILTALSKVFEKMFCRQLTSYFDRIFSKYLSGFRQKYSCQSTLLRMIEEWKSALDNGNMVGSIAIDLSRAF